MKPLVSIIIPTYNRAHLIGETLGSVIAQTYTNWECIVVDDGSTDYTDELLGFHCEGDNRIQYHHRPQERPKGANACRNYGFEMCKGEYIQWLDSDDLLSNSKIETALKLLKSESENSVIFCGWASFSYLSKSKFVQKANKIFNGEQSIKEFFEILGSYNFFLPPHAYLFSKKHLIKNGQWNEYLVINQDGEYISRILLTAKKMIFDFDNLVFYRRGISGNLSTYNSEEKIYDLILSWKLIEAEHKIRFKKEKIIYVENAKDAIFKSIFEYGYGSVVYDYKHFFKVQIRRKSLKFKVRKKIFLWVKKINDILKNYGRI